MNIRHRVYIFLIALLVLSTGIYAYVPKASLPYSLPENSCHSPHEVTELFFDSVNRGELKIFNKQIERSMLMPVRVTYIYDLNQTNSTLKEYGVYSKLKNALNIPGQLNDDLPKVSGINTSIDHTGKIIKTELHIWNDNNEAMD